MQFKRARLLVVLSFALLILVLVGVALWLYPSVLNFTFGSVQGWDLPVVLPGIVLLIMLVAVGALVLARRFGASSYRHLTEGGAQPVAEIRPKASHAFYGAASNSLPLSRMYLRQQYGWFWSRRIQVLLVVGESTHVNAIVPGLIERQWLSGRAFVLLYGGSLLSKPDTTLLDKWQRQFRWRGIDGVVWALSEHQINDAASMSACIHHLQSVSRFLGRQLPVHVWQVCGSQWDQSERGIEAVGGLLPTRRAVAHWEEHLGAMQRSLREKGLAQMQVQIAHDFLLRLARDLQVDGAARWYRLIESLAGRATRDIQVRGVWFSLPVQRPDSATKIEHHWPEDPAWSGILNDRSARARRLGWHPARVAYVTALGLASIWGIGLLLSFASNRAEVGQIAAAYSALQQPVADTNTKQALSELVRELSRLDYHGENGAPWYQRFGLNRSNDLGEAVWPLYEQANNRLLRDPAVSALEKRLNALVKLPPASTQRAEQARETYGYLKAYLMLARPEKADPGFLTETLGGTEPALWKFFGQHLPDHPDWAIKADLKLIAQTRQVLLRELGQRNAESSLYQQVLDNAANHYPALDLQEMVGDTDASALFSTAEQVPGVFTRQAWEGQVQAAIEDAAQARREEIDWVLSDNPNDIAKELRPDELRDRLTTRYFQGYSSAWLGFLNSLRWRQGHGLSDVIAQLTLMSDVRQSPLIALMNTLSYQGQAGVRGQALADSLIESAQKLVGQKAAPIVAQLPQTHSGPLDSTFGPLMALLGKETEGRAADDRLSLQTFLTRVTAVRLKLQQVASAPDPEAMIQTLAQTVFQGKGADLTDTQAYGNLIAASLGADWGAAGNTLFVQPLDQAWQQILQPSSAGLNRAWQRSIVDEWQGAFSGRYPFAATSSDASLPMLGQMIRADSGRIEQFLAQQLTGLLRKEGSRWVADPRQSQGLRFNPDFLTAINQLSHLADVLYTDGGMGLSFELQGKPVQDVVQTTFVLNGEKHHYFNQRESWQRFRWPGQGDYPGISLTWSSVYTGERLFADYQGTWGLIRLLEQATVSALDDSDSRFRVVLSAPDGLGLTWHLRTELGEGPLALLKLRDFNLPREIFLVGDRDSQRYTQNGSFE
ncbi:ImcF-related family protein [Pseudomonas monteilii]|uniref:Type VI secretion protein VasK n=1 Tax=Pseudomonas monteilii TaxID=76759 RepID=A0A399M714_9PSED|nr:ImcF-related family protein [Pseudomonas monteilii]RII77155.1 type VI secretion protein VasK [Pseudomonas monteilii]